MSDDYVIIDMHKMARRGGELAGKLAVSDLTLVHDRLASQSGSIDYQLQPAYRRVDCTDGQHTLLVIVVRLQAQVEMLCQRTLEAFTQVIDTESSVALVADDATAATLPSAYEPLVADARSLDMAALLSEELLLALPLVPTAPHTGPVRETLSSAANVDNNAFAVLGDLLRKD